MLAVILAAGVGNRMNHLTDGCHKALVRVSGKELILHTLDFITHPAVTERIVVTGFEAEGLKSFLKSHRPDVKTIYNPNFSDGSIRTIETALPYLNGDFVLLNADHIYPRRMLPHILKQRRGISAACDFDRPLIEDDMKVKLTDDKKLSRIKKTLEQFDGGYIGITLCEASCLPVYKNAVAKTREIQGAKAPVEFVLGHLATEGHPIHICDASGIRWLEVDTLEDLALAEATLKDNPEFLL